MDETPTPGRVSQPSCDYCGKDLEVGAPCWTDGYDLLVCSDACYRRVYSNWESSQETTGHGVSRDEHQAANIAAWRAKDGR